MTDNNDDTFLVIINSTQRMYYINENGKVIDNDNILKIETAEDLEIFRDEANIGNTFKDKAVILFNDINLSKDWTPIGYIDDNNIIEFNGDFNGLNHKINNLTINKPGKLYQGLFANIGNEGRVNSVVVTGNITGGKYLGGITGYNKGSIRNCGNEASITCQYDVEGDWNPFSGGIVGYNYNGIINGCYNKGQIISNMWSTGGIVGKSENGIIKNCYNLERVTGVGGEVGGICGIAYNTIFYNLYNAGNVLSNYTGSAGIIGRFAKKNEVRNTYNIAQVQGKGNNAGIIGEISENGIIMNCYSNSNILAEETAAGIVGQVHNMGNIEINNCYFYGTVKTPGMYRGTIIGQINGEYFTKNCEWYTEDQEYYNSMNGKTGIKFNENIDMKSVLEIVNGENFFESNGDDNQPKLYWELE